MDDAGNLPGDGCVLDPDRLADRAAIQDLATAYAHAVDDGDWARWQALFLPDALIDYTSAGGIAGTPAVVASWMPGAMSMFTFSLHTTSTHDIFFSGPDSATGRVHVFNRNGVLWDGRPEIVDVGAVYHDSYERRGDHWKIATRMEHTTYVVGGACADLIREAARATATEGRTPPFG